MTEWRTNKFIEELRSYRYTPAQKFSILLLKMKIRDLWLNSKFALCLKKKFIIFYIFFITNAFCVIEGISYLLKRTNWILFNIHIATQIFIKSGIFEYIALCPTCIGWHHITSYYYWYISNTKPVQTCVNDPVW